MYALTCAFAGEPKSKTTSAARAHDFALKTERKIVVIIPYGLKLDWVAKWHPPVWKFAVGLGVMGRFIDEMQIMSAKRKTIVIFLN
ncbi:MAG TPA: hypothetical protein PLA69_03310 [Flavobacterium sp.]|nr:hypothetical protein [Flavobacterium sp.]